MNDAGGLLTNVDARNYKNVSLLVECGVVGTSADCKLQCSATSGGSYGDIPGAAITQITTGPNHAMIDAEVPVGKPWIQVVLVTVGSTTVSGATLFGHDPTGSNRP